MFSEKIREIIGSGNDPDVLEYIVSIVDDEHFEFGDDCDEAVEAIGALLVRFAGRNASMLFV